VKSQEIYSCPMHPEVREYDPAFCPKCHMRLELVPPTLYEGENPDRLDEKSKEQNSPGKQIDLPYAHPQRQKPQVAQ
jgi:hypothetical protein